MVVTGSDPKTFLGLITMVATGPFYFGYLPPQRKKQGGKNWLKARSLLPKLV